MTEVAWDCLLEILAHWINKHDHRYQLYTQDRITLLLCDYRQIPNGQKFDRIISWWVVYTAGVIIELIHQQLGSDNYFLLAHLVGCLSTLAMSSTKFFLPPAKIIWQNTVYLSSRLIILHYTIGYNVSPQLTIFHLNIKFICIVHRHPRGIVWQNEDKAWVPEGIYLPRWLSTFFSSDCICNV
jgi:hypothetical protein